MKRPERPSEFHGVWKLVGFEPGKSKEYGVLSSRRVTKSYFEIHQKVLHHTLKIQKKLVGMYLLFALKPNINVLW